MVKRNGEVYLNASEAANFLDVPRHLFYSNVRPHVKSYDVKPRKQRHYRQSDLKKFQGIESVQKAS